MEFGNLGAFANANFSSGFSERADDRTTLQPKEVHKPDDENFYDHLNPKPLNPKHASLVRVCESKP